MPNASELENLLHEELWLRRIARQLAGDAQGAEDLLQETWLAARGRQHPSRGWLRAVIGNIWRQSQRNKSRRTQREAQVAREEAQPSTLELVAELSLRREVASALLALDEPYRRALYLRFHRDLDLASIAEQTGVGLSTVHDRIRLGLERMRLQLDRNQQRKNWSLGLLSLAKEALPTTPLLGAFAMGITIKLAAVGVVALTALLWTLGRRPAQLEAPAAAPTAHQEREATGMPVLQQLLENEAPAASRAEARAKQLDKPAAEARAGRLGRVLDLGGTGLADVCVGFDSENLTRSDSEGRFELPIRSSEQGMLPIESRDERYHTLVAGLPNADGESLLIVAVPVDFGGQVIDQQGAPIPGARLVLSVGQSIFREHGIDRPWSEVAPEHWTLSDANGEFKLKRVAGGAGITLRATASGYRSSKLELSARGDTQMRIELLPNAELQLRGQVLNASGEALAGALVSAGAEIAHSDQLGRFRLSWDPAAAGLAKRDENRIWVPEPFPHFIAALKPGEGYARLDLEQVEITDELILQLDAMPKRIQGRVVDSAGRGRAGVHVSSSQLTHFGQERRLTGDYASVIQVEIEGLLAHGGVHGAQTDSEGVFVLENLLEREYLLLARDPETLERSSGSLVHFNTEGLVLQLQSTPIARVAGRVLSLAGVPLAGVQISAQSSAPDEQQHSPSAATPPQLSDAEGRFAFERLAYAGVVFELYRDDFLWQYKRLPRGADLGQLEFWITLVCEVQIDLGQHPELADEFEFQDAEGRALEITESFGAFISLKTRSEISAARSNLLRIPESARTLVLYLNEIEVKRQTLNLDPAKRTTLRP